jgi:hypothetical protein
MGCQPTHALRRAIGLVITQMRTGRKDLTTAEAQNSYQIYRCQSNYEQNGEGVCEERLAP